MTESGIINIGGNRFLGEKVMSEKCPFCGALFTVTEIAGGGICGACREPIDCPHCKNTIREERTTGWFNLKRLFSNYRTVHYLNFWVLRMMSGKKWEQS